MLHEHDDDDDVDDDDDKINARINTLLQVNEINFKWIMDLGEGKAK
jgi:hypothetical protein